MSSPQSFVASHQPPKRNVQRKQRDEKAAGMFGKRRENASNAADLEQQHQPAFAWLPNNVRNHLIAMIGEFVGTFMFLFFAFSAVEAANVAAGGVVVGAPTTANYLYISLGFGFSLVVNIWVFFRISGGLFNPAVSTIRLSFP